MIPPLEASLVQKPFLVALMAGAAAQIVKLVSSLAVEKRLEYRRLVQTDGTPNMHSSAMSALCLAVGLREGFASGVFALALCLSVLVVVDTMNVKNAASKQAEVVHVLLERMFRRRRDPVRGWVRSYNPVDVGLGVVLGLVVALLLS